MVDKALLGAHHVADRHCRKVSAPTLLGIVAKCQWTGAAHAAAQHVWTNDKKPIGVNRPTGPDDHIPPTGLPGNGMALGNILITCERVADQHGIAAVGVQSSIG